MTDLLPQLPAVRTEELMARLGGSQKVLAQLLLLLTQSPQTWQAELNAAVAAGDADRVRRIAHGAKGAMLTVAAPRAAAAALAVEELGKAGQLTDVPAALANLMDEIVHVELAVRAMLGESP